MIWMTAVKANLEKASSQISETTAQRTNKHRTMAMRHWSRQEKAIVMNKAIPLVMATRIAALIEVAVLLMIEPEW